MSVAVLLTLRWNLKEKTLFYDGVRFESFCMVISSFLMVLIYVNGHADRKLTYFVMILGIGTPGLL